MIQLSATGEVLCPYASRSEGPISLISRIRRLHSKAVYIREMSSNQSVHAILKALGRHRADPFSDSFSRDSIDSFDTGFRSRFDLIRDVACHFTGHGLHGLAF